MQNIPIRKILASILFVLIIAFTYLIFKKVGAESLETNILILFGSLVFASLFLFSIIFTRSIIIKTVYEEKKDNTKKAKKEVVVKLISEKKSLKIISGFEKPANIKELTEFILTKLAREFSAVQGITYVRDKNSKGFSSSATYALYGKTDEFVEGSGINGQVAINKKLKIITDIPEGYITVISGLGSSYPSNLLILPFIFNNETIALIELASFEHFPEYIEEFYKHINNKVSKRINDLNS